MAKYPYRHTLDINQDPNFDARGRAIINAAFEVATLAHAGQSRDKIDPQWKYIIHPILTFDLMLAMGEKDPITLAGALLHDSLEQDSKYHGDTQELRKALWGRIQNTDKLASFDDVLPILLLVGEVTNPAAYGEGKEMYQVDRARTMSLAAKKVKIADQTASLICNLTMENDPQKFSNAKAANFTQKATSLVSAIVRSAEDVPEEAGTIRPYHHLFGRVLRRAVPLLKENDLARRNILREQFNYDRTLQSRSEVSILPVQTDVAAQLKFEGPIIDGVRGGVARVDIDQKGRVCSFVMRTAPSGGPQHWVNRMQQDIVQLLRDRSSMAHSQLQLGEGLDEPLPDGSYGRIYRLNVHPFLFVSAAGEAGSKLAAEMKLPAAKYAAMSREGMDTVRNECSRIEATDDSDWRQKVEKRRRIADIGKLWERSFDGERHRR